MPPNLHRVGVLLLQQPRHYRSIQTSAPLCSAMPALLFCDGSARPACANNTNTIIRHHHFYSVIILDTETTQGKACIGEG